MDIDSYTDASRDSGESIHDLMRRVREHPDFVFGTVFTLNDFAGRAVPDTFSAKDATDALVTAGNRLIEDAGATPDQDDEQ